MNIIRRLLALMGYAPVQVVPEVDALFKQHVGQSCEQCHRTFNNHMYWKFTKHMIDDHGVDRDVATDLMGIMAKAKAKLKIVA